MTAGPALPPGPRLPRAVQTLLFMRSRYRYAPRWRARYGPVFTMRMAFDRTVVAITRPEDVRAVFAGDPGVFHAGKGNAILAPVMGEESVLVLDGAAHAAARKRLMPAFTGAALRGYRDMMTGLAESAAAALPVRRAFGVHAPMNALTLEIILRVVFGLSDGERLTRLRPLIAKVADVGPAQILGWTYPRLQRFGPWRALAENVAAVDGLLHAEIAERRTADPTGRTDVLSRLLAADPDTPAAELRDHMMTLLLAGHETTATALAWTLHELARNPGVQERARAGDEDYLQAVVKEAMRLRPVVYSVARKLTEDTEVAGHLIPAGTVVAPSIGLAHRDSANHRAPDSFSPERFLGTTPENGTWIPFGGGVRRCIGAGFSLQEATTVLRSILGRYVVTPAGPPEPPKARNVTLVPSKGARIILTPL